MKILASVVVVVALSACASNGFLMAKPEVSLFGPTYPARDVSVPIEVFQSRMPDRPYTDIARIEVADTDDSWSMSQILKTAREIGADAVIVSGRSGSYAVGSSTYVAAKNYGLVAIAIKFK